MPTTVEGLSPWAVNKRLSASESRAAASALLAPGLGSGKTTPEGGVMPGTSSNSRLGVGQVTPTPGMQVTVDAGYCVIPVQGGYAYVGTLPTQATLDVPVADSSNPRIDLVIARVIDDTTDGGVRTFTVEILQGTPALDPSPPDTSGMIALPLGEVRVEANATEITTTALTDRRYFTRAAGGVRIAWNDGNRDGSGPGDMRYHLNNETLDVWTGDRWSPAASTAGWRTWTPELRSEGVDGEAVNQPIDLGTSGEKHGWYQQLGKRLDFKMRFLWGGSGFDGGLGRIYTELPPGFTGADAYQNVQTSLFVPHEKTNGGDYVGRGFIVNNSNRVSLQFPRSTSDCRVDFYTIALERNVPGQSVPYIPNDYAEGGTITVDGTVIIQ